MKRIFAPPKKEHSSTWRDPGCDPPFGDDPDNCSPEGCDPPFGGEGGCVLQLALVKTSPPESRDLSHTVAQLCANPSALAAAFASGGGRGGSLGH